MKRIYHTWEKWECYPAGLYEDKPKGMTKEEGEVKYRDFLSDLPSFEKALKKIIVDWKFSCEHYLSNPNMNRIAWLGQAAMAYVYGIPACCRGGYHQLTEDQKSAADELALRYLNKWLEDQGEQGLSTDEVLSKTQANLY